MPRASLPDGRLGAVLGDAAVALAARATGTVLQIGLDVDLPYPASVSAVERLDGRPLPHEEGRFDTIVSVAEVWRAEWSSEELARLVAHLKPNARLLFAEPVAVVGPSGRVQQVLDPVLRRCHGLGFRRDVPAALRTTGLVTIAVRRLSTDRWGRVRTIAVGVAQRRDAGVAPARSR